MGIENMHPINGTQTRYVNGHVAEIMRYRNNELIETYIIASNHVTYMSFSFNEVSTSGMTFETHYDAVKWASINATN